MSLLTPPPRPLAVSIGEPAGVGADIVLALAAECGATPPFVLFGDPAFLRRRAERIGLDVAIVETTAADAATALGRGLAVVPSARPMRGEPGHPDAADAHGVVAAIEAAVEAVRAGHAAAVVTLPVQKATLAAAGFPDPGHTEFLGALAERFAPGPWTPVMMLAGPELRTVPVTVHVPIEAVPRLLSTERIVAVGRIVARELTQRFGIAEPRLALAGLDPHAGEDGTIGSADRAIVAEAVTQLRAEGIAASGPHPADTLFHPAARRRYDVVLAMYHDQALIPVKTIAFADTVNVTLGLPFVRTSPDHGTALDLAGSGTADPASTLAAMRLAAAMAGADVRS
jgi:4-hydroxythreonine-4-phosphate dehydrogenase